MPEVNHVPPYFEINRNPTIYRVSKLAREQLKVVQRSCNWGATYQQQILAHKSNKCLAVDQFLPGAVNPA